MDRKEAREFDFPVPSRLAAGSYHSVVLCHPGWKDPRAGRADTSSHGSVVVFGSNRHHIFSDNSFLVRPKHSKEKGGSGQHEHVGGGEAQGQGLDPCEVLCFRQKNIAHVSCGSSHAAFLEKRGDHGMVWMTGLGTNGRLGFPRPQSAHDLDEMLKASEWHNIRLPSSYPQLKDSPVRTVMEAVKLRAGLRLADRDALSKWSFPCPMRVTFPVTPQVKSVSIVSVECGSDHTLALSDRGVVYSWGLGNFGSLGTGNTTDSTKPEVVEMPDEAACIAIAAGAKHSMALTFQGKLYSWGHGGHGRLGQGNRQDAALEPGPVILAPTCSLRSIAAGEAHSAAIDTLGNVLCWGAGSYGRTGHGEDIDQPVPKELLSLSGHSCKMVSLGAVHSLALNRGGDSVYAWGTGHATGLFPNSEHAVQATPAKIVPPGDPQALEQHLYRCTIVAVFAGDSHSLALQSNGHLYGWGLSQGGRLGKMDESMVNGEHATVNCPTFILDTGYPPEPEEDDLSDKAEGDDASASLIQGGPVEISCGSMHSAALTARSEIYSWGSNEYGQTGTDQDGISLDDMTWEPTIVQLSTGKVTNLVCGEDFCLAASEGRVWAWGRNHKGQLGIGHLSPGKHFESHPVQLKGLSGVKFLAAGEDHSAAILDSGELYTWGSTEHGKLGQGSSAVGGCQDFPRALDIRERLVGVSCGEQHTAIVSADNHLYTFGSGWYGRLGHGDTVSHLYPKLVEACARTVAVLEVHCGAYATYAVSDDRDLWCFGRDFTVCEAEHLERPKLFRKIQEHGRVPRVQALAAGASHTLLLTAGGVLWAWGDNQYGQLGHLPSSGLIKIVDPVQVSRMDLLMKKQVSTIAAGSAHSMALCKTGEVYAWGCPADARLGVHDPREEKDLHFEWKSLQPWRPRKVKGAWPVRKVKQKQHLAQTGTTNGTAVVAIEEEAQDRAEKKDQVSFGLLQNKLRNEPQMQRLEVLRNDEQLLGDQYQDLLQSIFSLWDAPPSDEGKSQADKTLPKANEWTMRQLQAQVEGSVCRNLKYMHLTDEFPDLERVRTSSDVAQRLGLYQELIWVLQQQPCYLGKLFRSVDMEVGLRRGRSLPAVDVLDIIRPITAIFQNLDDKRVRHLYMALICMVAKHEAQVHVQSAETAVQRLLRVFVRHPSFRSLHRQLLDVNFNKADESTSQSPSLISLMEAWTFHNSNLTADVALSNSGYEKIILAEKDFELYRDPKEDETLAALSDRERQRFLKQRYDEHIQSFLHFLGLGGGRVEADRLQQEMEEEDTRGKADAPSAPNHMTIRDFLRRFQIDSDIKMVLKRMESYMLEAKAKQQAYTARDREQQTMQIYETIGRIYIHAIFSELVRDHRGISEKYNSNLQAHIRAKLIKEDPVWSHHEEKLKTRVRQMSDKVLHNIRQLGRFFSPSDLGLPPSLLQAKEGAIRNLLPLIMKESLPKAEDRLAIDLQTDLYTAHFSIDEHVVQISTKDLLNLSNVLWYQINQEGDKNISMLVRPRPEIEGFKSQKTGDLDLDAGARRRWLDQNVVNDELYKLLSKIQPQVGVMQYKGENLDPDLYPELRSWALADMQDLEQLHNLRIEHRFLKHHRDVFFCSGCDAPCPRCLAPYDQAQETTVTLIKPFKPSAGPEFRELQSLPGGQDPFKELEELLGVLASNPRHQVSATRFLALTGDFDDIQRGILAAEPCSPEDLDTVARIDKAKSLAEALGLLKNAQEEEFRRFVQKAYDERAAQHKYLEAARSELNPIKQARERYIKHLERMSGQLRGILKVSEDCFVPPVVRSKAAEIGVSLVFEGIQRTMRREQRKADNATNLPWQPSATYPISWLRAKKVISSIGTEIPKEQYKFIMLKFSSREGGAWDVKMLHAAGAKTSILFSEVLDSGYLESMKFAGKLAKVSLQSNAVTLNSFNLLQLLARITAGAV